MELISVLMPVKNASSYLEECINSVISQNLKQWELLAVNDNSSDDSYDILRDYALKDPRIKVQNNSGEGIIDALNTGYGASKGKYISRMDADDIMTTDKLDSLYGLLKFHGKGHLAVGLVKYFKDSGIGKGYEKYAEWLNQLTIAGSNFRDIYRECSIPSPCWMVIKEDLERCGAFHSDRYPEDYDLAFRFRKGNLKILTADKVIHFWRDHPSRASRNDPNYSDNRFASLKVHHFLDQDRDNLLPLMLWGAGRKGKHLAKLLKENSEHFRWITNNSNKSGNNIYGIDVEHIDVLESSIPSQVLVGVSTFHKKNSIPEIVANFPRHQYYYFF